MGAPNGSNFGQPLRRRYRLRAFFIFSGHLFSSPAALMCASCWVLALCVVSLWHPLSLPLVLWLIPASIAFAIAYLGFEAWYRASGHETFTSPWGLPVTVGLLAIFVAFFRLIAH